MNLTEEVNKHLSSMHSAQGVDKGTPGENAAFAVCEFLYQSIGGILYHSYTYPSCKGLPGNIKSGSNGLFIENLGEFTEIDILYATQYRVFVIEVKSYKANTITLTDTNISGCKSKDKSPVHQNEMHCRHLYPILRPIIPDGVSKYIVPIVCFVDECRVVDNRSDYQKEYVKVTILNYLREVILGLNTPLSFRFDMEKLDNYLRKSCIKYSKYFPLRIVERR